ncbi:retrovirus-related pol polyprotein from transposon TNT 1-94 [Tanacetum coccineum]|uniref:Retrovirus-related pol polyprotein from transposon TNT 1-94 n=1 Tax=Tanacetum coccineum TaxID=301880 RepID=A0ABQ5G2Z3_9ASTR
MQLQQEVFQNDESCVNQNAVEIQKYFEINDLKARLQDKDTTIYKVKDTIKSLSKNTKEEKVNPDKCDLEPINKELENSVAKLLYENKRLCNEINHVKRVFKDQFDSIKHTRVCHKEQWKEIVENVVHTPSATTIAPGMFKLDLEPLPPRLLQNREVHITYLRNTQEQANILWEIVKQAKAKQPLDSELDLALLNNVKKVRFAEPLTSSSKIQRVESSNTSDSNTPVLSSTGVKCSTSNCGSEHSLSNANSEILCATCNKSMFDGIHDKCLLDLVQNENNMPPKQTTSHSAEIQIPEIKVYSRKPKNVKNIGSSKMAKIVESKNANHSEPNHTWGSNATYIPPSSSLVMTGTVRFRNDQIARIMGYGDYQLGKVIISRVYYVDGLGHNLFSVGQFCDADLEVAFRKNTCFIRNLEGVDLLSGSRDTNLYTISLDDMLKSSPICLLSKSSKTKSWLWHRRLSHLNFGTLNKLAKDGLARGIPRLKFQKDHLCSAYALGKSKKSSHQPKAEDTNQEKLYLLHMDLCGPMHVASINGKKVYLSDSRRLLKIYQDNGAEFVNQTLREFYENVGISHQTSVARTPQQNGVVESSRPGLHSMTPATSCTRLVSKPVSQQPCIPPTRDDWDRLFQPMFDEYFNPPTITVSLVQEAVAPKAEVLADSPVSISINQDAPSTSLPSSQEQEHSPINS